MRKDGNGGGAGSPAADASILGTLLAPLSPWLGDPAVTEILCNRPHEIWVERKGAEAMVRHELRGLTAERQWRIARAAAGRSGQTIGEETPLLSARLPGGERLQCAAAPLVSEGVAFAIRRAVLRDMSLADLDAAGLFSAAHEAQSAHAAQDARLKSLLDRGEWSAFLQAAVAAKKTVVVSGGTSSGKTTLANALLKAIPPHERLVTIEDARELSPPQGNHLALIASRGGQSRAKADAGALLEAALRLRPDRILLGELRGAEAYAWLRAVSTGHPGSIVTVHADDPEGALDQIAFMAAQAGLNLRFEMIRAYAARIVDVVVQIERRGAERRVTAVHAPHL